MYVNHVLFLSFFFPPLFLFFFLLPVQNQKNASCCARGFSFSFSVSFLFSFFFLTILTALSYIDAFADGTLGEGVKSVPVS